MPRMHRPSAAADLFGDIPVTVSDLQRWAIMVAGIAPHSPRYAQYVRAWNVADKVRAAKRDGSFDRLTDTDDPCEACRLRCQSPERSGK